MHLKHGITANDTLSTLTGMGGYRQEEKFTSNELEYIYQSTKYILTSARNCPFLQVRTTESTAALITLITQRL